MDVIDLGTARLERRVDATERELAAARAAMRGILDALEQVMAHSGNAALIPQIDGLRTLAMRGADDHNVNVRTSVYAKVTDDPANNGAHSG